MSWIKNTIAGLIGIPTLDEVVMYVNQQLNGVADYSAYSNVHKLKVIFSNPALLKVISLQCELFSLGKIYVYKNGKEIYSDPFLNMIKKPNTFQTEQQMKWDFMFWQMMGNSYQYIESNIVSEDNKMYFLASDKLEMPNEIEDLKDKLILSSAKEREIKEINIKYKYSDGTYVNIPWGNVVHIPDLTNGNGNWFSGSNRIDALFKVVANSEAALDAKNINLRYSGKFMVAGKSDPANPANLPMGEEEKQSIEQKINGQKSVHAVKSMIDIKRFVENIGALKLDDSYLADLSAIGSIFQIPKDVLEAMSSSTYENQEKARGAHVSYCLQPKGDAWMASLASYFGYDRQGKEIYMDWEHLPFMQAFAKERAETKKITSETLLNYMDAGVPLNEINEILDCNFTYLDYEKRLQTRQTQRESNTNT